MDARVRLAGFVVMVAVLLGGSVAVAGQEATPIAEGAGAGWMAVVHFESAAISLDPGMASEATVVLQGVDDSVVEFTEGPDRLTRVVPTADFAVSIADQEANPVNADLAATVDDEDDSVQLVIEVLSMSFDPDQSLMTTQVEVLNAYLNGAPVADERVVADGLGSGYLFVDGR